MKRSPLKRVGKKTRLWESLRAKLKKEFELMDVTRCEVCGTDNGLTFAHRRKRRFITDEQELRCVALLCLTHHSEVENLSHDQMFERITEIIEKRENL